MKSKVLLLLAVVHQQYTKSSSKDKACEIGAKEMADGEVGYSFLLDKGTRKYLVTNCTVNPFPNTFEDQVLCNTVTIVQRHLHFLSRTYLLVASTVLNVTF